MNATQAENLRILIRYMESVPVERLEMGSTTSECGSPACAMGHARTVPALKAQCGGGLMGDATDVFGLRATHDVMDPHYWGHLFGAALLVHDKSPVGYSSAYRPTPREWAAEARKVLAAGGYSMDEKPDAFAAFMAKVREPVAVTA